MSTKENKALARRIFEDFNNTKRNPESLNKWLDKYFAPKVIFQSPTGEMYLDQYRPFLLAWSSAFPDAVFNVNKVIAEDDITVIHYTWQGTHKGEYMGIKPTGKSIKGTGIYIDRISKGQIIDSLTVQDTYGFLQQLGAIPKQ
jgi:steroid delta-isomerase-like uncharacterized protein